VGTDVDLGPPHVQNRRGRASVRPEHPAVVDVHVTHHIEHGLRWPEHLEARSVSDP